jgi:hypothetical protein
MTLLAAVLRLGDVYPGARNRIFPSRTQKILDTDQHQRVEVFLTQKLFLSSRKYDRRCSFRIRIFSIPDQGIQGSKTNRIPDPSLNIIDNIPVWWYNNYFAFNFSRFFNARIKVPVPVLNLLLLVWGANRARIFKLLRNPKIDSKDSIPPACVAWRAGTTTLFLFGS